MFARSIASVVALSALVLTGCSAEPAGTPGQLNNLRFELSIAGPCAGCTIEREVLTGSAVTIEVHGLNAKNRYLVRSTAPDVAEFWSASHCSFVGQEDCHDRVDAQTSKAGDAVLEIFDEWTGTVLDRVTLKVRDAAEIETNVKVTRANGSASDLRPTGGVFELKVDSDVEIVSVARSAGGSELIATEGAIRGAYADARVIAPRRGNGPGTTEYARALTAGATTVAVASGSTRRELAFRVID
jgi:hypothetical protein